MDYVITDPVTSPLELAHSFTEKLAYMPHTFFIGDHMQMFKHLKERFVLKGKDQEFSKDNVTIVNGANLEPILSKVDQDVKVH